jgi:hypothetical protein
MGAPALTGFQAIQNEEAMAQIRTNPTEERFEMAALAASVRPILEQLAEKNFIHPNAQAIAKARGALEDLLIKAFDSGLGVGGRLAWDEWLTAKAIYQKAAHQGRLDLMAMAHAQATLADRMREQISVRLLEDK